MPVDDFALARGATAPVTSKQEAEKVWEPKFIAEIVSGKDPRVPIERETKFERPTTVTASCFRRDPPTPIFHTNRSPSTRGKSAGLKAAVFPVTRQ
jgi:hypothetical protein